MPEDSSPSLEEQFKTAKINAAIASYQGASPEQKEKLFIDTLKHVYQMTEINEQLLHQNRELMLKVFNLDQFKDQVKSSWTAIQYRISES